MSIDEVMASIIEYGIEQRRATINESIALRASIKRAIEQYAAEAVAKETERCAGVARQWEDDYVIEDSAPRHVDDAIRARAEKETK